MNVLDIIDWIIVGLAFGQLDIKVQGAVVMSGLKR